MRLIVVLIAVMVCAQACAEGYGFLDREGDGYKSAAGVRYKYDLNRPTDQIRYETDVGAQLRDERDSWTKSPYRELQEELYGQRGGGVKR